MRALTVLLILCCFKNSMVLAQCQQHYAGGQGPMLSRSYAQATRLIGICYNSYSIGYSIVLHDPLWSADKLTPDSVAQGRCLPRVNDFHSDTHLSFEDGSNLADYRHSGYDRGHMVPSGDAPTSEAQDQTFSLANIVPQTLQLNRFLWEDIEKLVRTLAAYQDVYVVTGPVFVRRPLVYIHGRVAIPDLTYKAIAIEGRGTAVFLATNTGHPVYKLISVAELQSITGIDVFPALPKPSKSAIMTTPPLRRYQPVGCLSCAVSGMDAVFRKQLHE